MIGVDGRHLARLMLPLGLLGLNVLALALGHGGDFNHNVWDPALAVRDFRSPYPPPELTRLIEPSFLYPPLLLTLAVPLSLLGHDGARVLFWALELTAVLGALRLVGVRDQRVYLWAGASHPVWVGLALGNPTLLLLPALAAAWRWRDRWWAVALAVGLLGAFKLIVWPVGLWLLATGRIKSAAMAAAVAIAGVFVPWALIGFDGLSDYPTLLQIFGENSGAPRSLTISTLLDVLGAPATLAHGLRWACGFAAIVGVVLLARRPDGDRRAFSLAIAAVLVTGPVVERVYFALLLVPLAVARPLFGLAWIQLVALWAIAVLPSGPRHAVVEDGRVLESFGYVPTVPQLLVALAVLSCSIVVTAGPPRHWETSIGVPEWALSLRRLANGPRRL